jgi:hypothetical protein
VPLTAPGRSGEEREIPSGGHGWIRGSLQLERDMDRRSDRTAGSLRKDSLVREPRRISVIKKRPDKDRVLARPGRTLGQVYLLATGRIRVGGEIPQQFKKSLVLADE